MAIPQVRIVKDDIVVVTDAFILSFFVNESHETLVRRIEEVLRIYIDFVGLGTLPYRLDEDGEIVDNEAGGIDQLLYDIFHRDPKADTSVIRLVGAVDDQTGYGFNYVGDHLPDPEHPDLRNLVALWLPTKSCLERGWEAICDFSLKVARLLPYSYGYGSPCLAYGDSIRAALGPGRRHPGFDIALGIACRVDIDEKALGAYWLNFLGESLCQKLGGTKELAKKLGPPIIVKEVGDNRIIVRLGSEPEVGDTNRQIELPLYRQFAKVTESELHVPKSVYFPDENGIADNEAMTAWHRRFLTS
jgi:hypothetical protein